MKSKNNRSIALNVLAIAVGMFCLAYAAVPLYDLFCRVTGFGGTPTVAKKAPDHIIDRKVTVRFNTDVSPDLPWEFTALSPTVTLNIGEEKLVFFKAKNMSDAPVTGTSIYNVLPDKVASYFNKIQCFCFERQTINPGESVEFPVSFFIDPEIIRDKNLDDITTITLSYSFFRAKE